MGSPIYDALLATSGVRGIDTASYQGDPNWPTVAAAGYSFAYCKASEGASSSYASVDAQFNGATAAGLVTGLYHYANPGLSPTANADAFAKQINRLTAWEGHLPPCLDLETGSGDLSAWAAAFIEELRAKTGCRRVMVYSGASFFTDHIGESWMDADTFLWIAHYGQPPGQPAYLTPRVAIHQFSPSGAVPGIAGDVDLDYAIWPLNKLTGEEDELTPDEHNMLVALYEQHSGSTTVVQDWPGHPTWGGGTHESLTILDYARRSNVEVRQAWLAIQSLQEQLSALTATVNTLAPKEPT